MDELQAATSAAMALSGREMPSKVNDYPVKTKGEFLGNLLAKSNLFSLPYQKCLDVNIVKV